MINIQYRQGNIIDALKTDEFNTLAHQCNCVTKGVAGFANVLFTEFPTLATKHYEYIKNNPNCFGTISTESVNDKLLINMYSQYYPGQPNTIDFYQNGIMYKDDMQSRSEALTSCLKEIFELPHNDIQLVMPLVASGLAANRYLKNNMTDLEYFTMYIEPIILESLKENKQNITITIFYL